MIIVANIFDDSAADDASLSFSSSLEIETIEVR